MQAGGKRAEGKILMVINWILFAILSFFTITDLFIMFKYNLLNFKKINYIILAFMAIILILLLVLNIIRKGKIFTTIISTFFIIVTLFAFNYMNKGLNLFNKLNENAKVTENTMVVLVRADSDMNSINDVKGKVLAPTELDKENIDKLVKEVEEKANVKLNIQDTKSYLQAYEDLISGKSQVMVLNAAHGDLIANAYPDYLDKVKKIYEYKIVEEVKEEKKDKEVTGKDSFNIYVSGIDTYGPITTVSRSDVNVLITVNKKTHKIVLTTTPRDAYVKIAGGGNNQYDKLTHSGIYGVKASVKTLENLYGINIEHYARVNFTTFMKLIDLVGGIDVYNDQDFVSRIGNYHFPVGTVHLNSEKALGFVRERYNLADGDRDRGKNHEKVIAAIIKKMTSKAALSNFSSILDELSSSVQTDMPVSEIMELVNQQIDSGEDFKIESQALNGVGKTGLPSYAMPGYKLYMMEVDKQSLENCKSKIQSVLQGK
ncbi:LCP family protein [Parvimonas sp. D2]|uniref:LCP family glycopolymer transferase CpsA n=1 Tax=unclassified Parvimonas TaxID=1151464 RepID=UPI002B486A69|nr:MULTISPECIES: LCP family protein [unclassified Parvimonas]MEB3012773.1 LCP family protein [Parvimonas sp. D2]MEB3088212.1 LCP family protein [Parvimonas sp. D4]